MKQSDVSAPVVTDGAWRPLLSALKLHVSASLLRTLLWCMTGNGSDFDKYAYVPTKGLGTGRVKCAVCIPQTADLSQPLPTVFVFEGGGFILGQPEDGQQHDRRLSDRLNAIVISVEYAKAPRHPYPHALLQIYEVVRWALSSAAKEQGINVDPRKVAFLGNSAGGNLAATLSLLVSFTSGPNAAFRQGLPTSFTPKLQVLLYPSIETGVPYNVRLQRATPEVQALSLPASLAQPMEDSYLPPYIDRSQIFVQPLLVDQDLLTELHPPPALILTAGMDCLKSEADSYSQLLRAAGVEVVSHDYAEAVHGFSHFKKGKGYRPDDIEDCWSRIENRLREAFQ